MNIFDPDSKFIQFFQFLGDLIILNLCFLICCLPVITIGAACTAMYTITLQEAEGTSGSIVGRFFRVFRADFGKSTCLWFVLLLLGSVLGYNYLFLAANPTLDAAVFRGLLIVLTVIYGMITAYAFPLQVRFKNTLMRTLRNALALAVGNLPQTVLILLLNFLPFLVLLLSEELFIRVLIFLVLIYFAGSAQINSLMLAKIFRRFQEETE